MLGPHAIVYCRVSDRNDKESLPELNQNIFWALRAKCVSKSEPSVHVFACASHSRSMLSRSRAWTYIWHAREQKTNVPKHRPHLEHLMLWTKAVIRFLILGADSFSRPPRSHGKVLKFVTGPKAASPQDWATTKRDKRQATTTRNISKLRKQK